MVSGGSSLEQHPPHGTPGGTGGAHATPAVPPASSELPHTAVSIDIHADDSLVHGDIRRVCRDLLPSYRGVDPKALEVTTISGGITNILAKVEPPAGGSALPVTVRIFGDNTDVFIDRTREIQALRRLNAAGFGAQVLGLFENGRIEAFLTGKTLGDDDLADPAMVNHIAPLLRRFHACNVSGSGDGPKPPPQLFPTLRRWHAMASRLSFDDPAKQAAYEKVDVAAVGGEVEALEALLTALDAPTVYCHNDVLSGNLMFDEDTDTMHIIDFEYGCYGYRGFDIGNHFNEYAGFECDYKKYPSKEAQVSFFRQYLGGEPSGRELESLYAETNAFALASHVYWALWALVQAKYSPIDFDYLGYFHLRMAEYHRRKAEALSLIPALRLGGGVAGYCTIL